MSQNNTALNHHLDASLVAHALDLLASARKIALLAHERPDGDCIGSALGLAFILRAMGKICVPVCADPLPEYLSFLPGTNTLEQGLGDESFELVIALDAGELYRFGSVYEAHRDFLGRVPILNIDHHISNGGCGQVNLIDTRAAATAEMLVLFQQQANLPLTSEAALCLMTGLITDTSSFQFTNTTPRCLEVAAELLRHNITTETIVQPIYRERSLAVALFQAIVIEQARTACDGRLIWSWSSDETLTRSGITSDMDPNTAGLLRDIAGVQIAAFFKSYATSDETRLSLRCAAPYNAAELCYRLSHGEGGGHARAAGATFHGSIEQTMALVIPELERELSNTQA